MHLNESTTDSRYKNCNGGDYRGAVVTDAGEPHEDDVIFYNLETSELLKVLLRPDAALTNSDATVTEGDSRSWNSKKSTVSQTKSKKRFSDAGDAVSQDISDRSGVSEQIFSSCCAGAIIGVENGIMDEKCCEESVDEQCEEHRDNLQRFLSDDSSSLSGINFDDDLPVFPREFFDDGCMEYLLEEAQRSLCINSPASSNESDSCPGLVELKTVSKTVSSSSASEQPDEINSNCEKSVNGETSDVHDEDVSEDVDEAMVLVPSGKSFISLE